jgi:uncharacterized repeat protein (TIGR04076 family)
MSLWLNFSSGVTMKKKSLDLNIDFNKIKEYEEYKKIWEKVGKIEIKMVEKNEQCKHNLGDIFILENPYSRPENLCNALLHVLNLYTWRVAFGFPSWNGDNRRIFKLHCPDPKGTVWEMRKIEE